MALHHITVSPSEIDTIRQCPLKHKILYHERWTKPASESHPLGFGTLWHTTLDAHYQVVHRAQAYAQAELGGWWAYDRSETRVAAKLAAYNVIMSAGDEEVRDLLRWMYDGHLEHYGLDPQWQIIAVEFPAEVVLPEPEGFNADLSFSLKMKIDMIVKVDGRIVVVDHKSCKNLPGKLDLDFDDQFGLYAWGMQRLGYDVHSLIYSAARKTKLKTKEAPLEERFSRPTLIRGNRELAKIAMEAWQTAYSAYRDLFELQEFKRKSGIDIEPARRPQPSQCGWKCDFTNACIMGRKGTDFRDTIHRQGYRIDKSRH